MKPYFDRKELAAAFSGGRNAVAYFENKFAAKFGARYGVAFLYGRGGIYALLKSLGIKDSEVIMPAYTCVVAANAVVYSGNIPRFVDIDLDNYCMNLELLQKAINDKTKMIIGTSLFGYPYDADGLRDIIKRSGRDIFLLQDCAHSFGVEYKGRLLCNTGDAALFAFSITKELCAIYGGMITTNDPKVHEILRRYRDDFFKEPSGAEHLKMLSLFLAVYVAFFGPFYGITNFLERRTGLLDPIAKYYDEEKISMPADFMDKLPSINAKIGIAQLDKYDLIKTKRRAAAKFYNEALKSLKGITPPRLIDGATYLYCVSMVDNKEKFIENMRKKGIQIGRYLEYAIPYMKAYEKYRTQDYPNAYRCSRGIVDLPCHPSLSERELKRIVGCIKSIGRAPAIPS